jgi:CheY-like chemotaxis protein
MSIVSLATVEKSRVSVPSSRARSRSPDGLRVLEIIGEEAMPFSSHKVLLLEDDPAFREIMTDFLQENGFEVTAVRNGVEGVHKVLASDFEMILCDMMMPTLPGDMFFRAVQRMRPHLCDRFVFMTGHRSHPRIKDFIDSVWGTVLIKPFRVSDLLEMIEFVRLRSSVFMAA